MLAWAFNRRPDRNAAAAAADAFEESWLGGGNTKDERGEGGSTTMDFTVDAVYLISRKGGDAPFEFKARIPLGGRGGGGRGGDGGGGGGAKEEKKMSSEGEEEEEEWWTQPYAPPPPPEVGRLQAELCLTHELERRMVSKS